jgi:hypothetical protein
MAYNKRDMQELEGILKERYQRKPKSYLYAIWGYAFPIILILGFMVLINRSLSSTIIGSMIIGIGFVGCKTLQEYTELVMGWEK